MDPEFLAPDKKIQSTLISETTGIRNNKAWASLAALDSQFGLAWLDAFEAHVSGFAFKHLHPKFQNVPTGQLYSSSTP